MRLSTARAIFCCTLGMASAASWESRAATRARQWAPGSDTRWGVPRSGRQLCARVRYGINLLQSSPLEAVAHSSVPVLLIHGGDDRNIAPRHSQLIAAAAQDHVTLWLVPHAGHTKAWTAAHREFEGRLLSWFTTHLRTQDNISNSSAVTSF